MSNTSANAAPAEVHVTFGYQDFEVTPRESQWNERYREGVGVYVGDIPFENIAWTLQREFTDRQNTLDMAYGTYDPANPAVTANLDQVKAIVKNADDIPTQILGVGEVNGVDLLHLRVDATGYIPEDYLLRASNRYGRGAVETGLFPRFRPQDGAEANFQLVMRDVLRPGLTRDEVHAALIGFYHLGDHAVARRFCRATEGDRDEQALRAEIAWHINVGPHNLLREAQEMKTQILKQHFEAMERAKLEPVALRASTTVTQAASPRFNWVPQPVKQLAAAFLG